MWPLLQGASSVRFVATIHADGSQGPDQRVIVQASWPASVRITDVTDRPDEAAAANAFAGPCSLFVADGAVQYEEQIGTGVCFRRPAAPRLSRLRGRLGLPALIGADLLFAARPHRAQLRAAGHAGRLFVRPIALDGRRGEQRLHLGADGLPERIEWLAVAQDGRLALARRTDFEEWELDPLLNPLIFDTEVSPTAAELPLP